MVYHSQWNGFETEVLCGCGVYDVKLSKEAIGAGAGNGPAKNMPAVEPNEETGENEEKTDILDEVLYYFKANMLFRAFNLKGPGDCTMLYMMLYVQQVLKRIVGLKKDKAKNAAIALGIESFETPADRGFIFGDFFAKPSSPKEAERWAEYIKQLRLELGLRVVEKTFKFPEADGTGNKFWLSYSKGTLLNKCFEK